VVAPVERASAVPVKSPCQGTLQVHPWTLNGFIPEADVPDRGSWRGHRIAWRNSPYGYSGSREITQDRWPQGCGHRAYRDVFTASLEWSPWTSSNLAAQVLPLDQGKILVDFAW